MSKEGKVVNLINSYLGKEDKFKGIQKAKPKVLKPGSPEHTKAMAEVEATKAAKPKSTNPAGEESPSRPGSRDKLGERPLVEGIDKQVLQTAAERAGAGLRGGQSAPAPTTPAPPTTDVAPNKNLRRLWLTPSLIMTFSLNLKKWNSKHAGSRVSKKGPE